MMQLISCSPWWPPVIYNSVNRHWSIAFISLELEIPPITSIGSFRSKISLEWDFECCIWRQLVKSTVLRENNSWKDNYSKKALVYHLSRMFMDVIYRVKSCKNKQTNKERKKQKKTKTKTWEYTQYENIILLITGYHTALGWAVGISPHDIDLSTQTVMYLNRLLYLWYKFWNHWWALQFNWLSAVWFIRESPDFLL